MDLTTMDGITHNYIPSKLNKNKHYPWKSASQMSHIRGSSVHKWHTTLIGYGSFAGVAACIMKLFEIHQDDNLSPKHQIIAVYIALIASIGGLILVNFEVYASPIFSKRYNICCEIIHTFGAFCYGVLGNFSFAFWYNFDFVAVSLLVVTIGMLIIYRGNRWYQYRKKLNNTDMDGYEKWVHNMSRANVGIEVGAIGIAAIAGSVTLHRFGDN